MQSTSPPDAARSRSRSEADALLPPKARGFLDRLGQLGLLGPSECGGFLRDRLERLREYTTDEKVGQALVQAGMLTMYQFERVLLGSVHGLVLGSYRVLDELGRGGMGTVYLAEHRLLRRRVAIKVLPLDDDCPDSVKQRFYGEMRVLAELSHPNVVLALDAGELEARQGTPPLIYLAMELVEGGDLEKHVVRRGVLGVPEACHYIRQAAAGLQAAHDRHLIHRDLKPSNLLLTATKEIKLVDFGLARQFASRLTDQRALLGSVEFMPPEQSHDPSLVGKEADIYGLGATLFWLITGEGPYPYQPHVGHALRVLQQQEPRRLRALRADVPRELDELVARMLDRDPARRPTSALAVINAMRQFQFEGPGVSGSAERTLSPSRLSLLDPSGGFRALVVDDEMRVRMLHKQTLEQLGCNCVEARDGQSALEAVQRARFDLVLLDLKLPDIDGYEVCRRIREKADNPTLKIIVVSAAGDQNELADSLPRGADDYVAKPYELKQLIAKARHALTLKAAQDRAARLTDQLMQVNQQLEQSLTARNADLREAHNALLFAMAKIAESRDGETPGHLKRMQRYTKTLAQEAAKSPPWQGLVDGRFLEQLERCVPLHDIGKIGLPDDILLKPASLSPTERTMVQTHPVIGDLILGALGKEYGAALDFLGIARVIVRHHHERFDGKGYPDKLQGDAIPPAARLVAVADVYDTLRRMRLYKPAMSHSAAIRTMIDRSPGQFDPTLMTAFGRCHSEFERIFKEFEE
jgi:response regulator RpfG family c-di-GMP phosphodiesterase/serine/threonine protein kinase